MNVDRGGTMDRSKLFLLALARTAVLVMAAFTLVVAVRVLGETNRPVPSGRYLLARSADLVADGLPPGHPPIDGCVPLPPGHPRIDARRLPAGHPPIPADDEEDDDDGRLPPGHPPVDGPIRMQVTFPQDGTSTI
jgi:hypothetical protein